MKRIISLTLVLVMALSSMSIGAFAATEDVTAGTNTPAAEIADSKPTPPPAVTDLKTYSAYNSIALEWDPVAGATQYKVYRDGKLIKSVGTGSRAYDNKNKMSFIDSRIRDDKNHKYIVTALNENGESAKCDTVSDARARTMHISITFKRSRKLRSHDSAKVRKTFKAGTTVKAYSFRSGQYIFCDDKGHIFHINYNSIRKPKALYTKKLTYSTKEAEYFANTSKIKSSTKYMIWVNLYTQHLYILKREAGKWRSCKLSYNGASASHWEISSGKAATPTPAGMKHRIRAKQASKWGIKSWNYFHSLTALHGQSLGKAGARFGAPYSHGCIRNPNKYALMIYKEIPRYTRVTIY